MKVQHGQDLANHSGPESCGGAREGAAEALTGETGGSAIEPRNPNAGGRRLQRKRQTLGAEPEPHPSRRPCQSRDVLPRGEKSGVAVEASKSLKPIHVGS